MCMLLYLGTDEPAPLVAWDESAPQFNVTELTDRESGVRRHFSGRFVYCIGSHTHCSCGFRSLNLQPDGGHLPVEYAELEEPAKSDADHRHLADYLRDRLHDQSRVELYLCWEGDWAESAALSTSITPGQISSDGFFFAERGHYAVSLGADSEQP